MLFRSKGNFAFAMGLGLVLITLAVIINLLIHIIGKTERASTW